MIRLTLGLWWFGFAIASYVVSNSPNEEIFFPLAGLVGTGLIAWWFQRFVADPLSIIADTNRRIATELRSDYLERHLANKSSK